MKCGTSRGTFEFYRQKTLNIKVLKNNLAERTGLEPATPGVTGQYSKPTELPLRTGWWVLQGLNLRPTACKAVALPTELNTPR